MNKSSYPKIREVQIAHRKLIQEYIAAIDAASKLPFFVNISRIQVSYPGETTFERWIRETYAWYTAITWKPFVNLLIELHIKSKMKELERAYRQLALQLPDGKTFNQEREWLKAAIHECDELSSTLSAWKSTQTLSATALPVLFGWAGSLFGIDSLSDLLAKVGMQGAAGFAGNAATVIYLVFWATLTACILTILSYLAFQAKRAMFMPASALKRVELPVRNVYETENRIFGLLDRKKTPEFAIDNLVGVLYASLCLVLGVLLLRFWSPDPVLIGLLFLLILIMFYGLFIMSRQRWN